MIEEIKDDSGFVSLPFGKQTVVGSAAERITKAEKYINECEWLFCQGAVFSETGYYYKDVMKAIRIAAGVEE